MLFDWNVFESVAHYLSSRWCEQRISIPRSYAIRIHSEMDLMMFIIFIIFL
jgi:hypothetical protein